MLKRYFNYYNQTVGSDGNQPNTLDNERELYDSMLIESIQHYGIDVQYISKETNNLDLLFGEDSQKKFTDTQTIEMYIESEFIGDDSLNFIGYDVKDEINLLVSRTRFKEDFGHAPEEGDLIMIPLVNETKGVLFEIRFVEDEKQFYPLAKLMQYKLKCSLWEHSNEEFDTFDADIDSMNLDDLTEEMVDIETTNGDNVHIQDEADKIIDRENNPFGDY